MKWKEVAPEPFARIASRKKDKALGTETSSTSRLVQAQKNRQQMEKGDADRFACELLYKKKQEIL